MDCKRRGKKKTKWKQKVGNKQSLREHIKLEKHQKCLETWQTYSNKATLEPDPIEDLLVRKTLEYKDIATS
jgi:hypothetical protein